MNRFSKHKKLIIGSLTALACFGAIGGVALSLNSTLEQHNTSISGNNGININNNVDLPQIPATGGNSSTVVGGDNVNGDVNSSSIRMTLTRTVSVETQAETYEMKLENNKQKEGTIYFVTEEGLKSDKITFSPGQDIKLLFDPNKGYEGFTVREFKISGAKENHYVPTKNDPNNKLQFIASMPTYEETVDKMTGESWLYAKDTPITIVPSFIIADIGQNGQVVEWEHGTFMNVVNGYVYNLTSDAKLSEILNHYQAFKNDDITNPINLFFYLNGHTLTMDRNVTGDDVAKYAPSGWSLGFFNNGTDTATEDGKYGSIVLGESYNNQWTNGNIGKFEFRGSMSFGYSISYRYVNLSNGIQFLNMDDGSKISGEIVNKVGK